MVKFGRHLQFYLECDELKSGASKPYIVPYKDIRGAIGDSQEEFQKLWLNSLKAVSDDYTQRLHSLWQQIFSDLFRFSRQDQNVLRGLPREDAVQLYLSTMSEKKSRDLLTNLKRFHSNASMNGEALRKLVKKYDKQATARGDDILTTSLLPELYSAPVMDAPAIEGYIEILRDKLVVSDEEEEESLDEYMTSIKEKTQLGSISKDALDVQRRASEMFWLHDLIKNQIPEADIPMLVAHRGFHCVKDHSGKRPLENSLSSYESAWSAGVHLCECDVALTKDEKLVLAHDSDFSRLALDPSKNKKVSDLTMKEIIGLTFKSGTRPPLLLDVLRSAQTIGGSARLVIEIKAGNDEAGAALVRLFRRHPTLIARCAVVMSFDAYLMHRLRTELSELIDQGPALSRVKLPELLLLTIAEPPSTSYELFVSVDDFSQVDSWLQHEGKPSLDGVYLQFQPQMLQPQGLAALRALSAQYEVGVWMMLGDPDDIGTAACLVEYGGVSYVNTDLPRTFSG
eukprot:CAMPEP_0201730694 /NCGR_PEP_ID=MMETSP0593-20130828/23127_1 /ASSEMBLY_ACC=CAM_ASM_000672 /TAXON_ID=267983 /ORGANISM="Skeletonema japonicum, Strain CCMP2506" /LENGTH=510 /DNA_ID=CAMNT_0048223291 /DNA_START=57 /DNA_END=1589 /DNA_ORIENTATION=+